MRPVLEKARRWDIAREPAPHALFEALTAGFNLWCTPDDHPAGWEGVPMIAGAFAKPCEYVATATWGWEDERITHIQLGTEAYALRERRRGRPKDYRNRPEDVEWATAKLLWLFNLAGIACPPIRVPGDE